MKMRMPRLVVTPEGQAVYDAENRARDAMPRPLLDGRAVTALVRIIEQQAAFGGNRTTVSNRGTNKSYGGVKFTRGKKPINRDLRMAWELRQIDGAAYSAEWTRRLTEYWSRPLRNEYFVQIATTMRDAYTVTHEMAHVLQCIMQPMRTGRLGHGLEFRTLHLQILDALDPVMAAAVRAEYRNANLEV